MKAILSPLRVLLMALALSGTIALAQDDGNATYKASDATSVVYQTPVTYFASVVYQAPVAYYAPVYYQTATPAAVVDCAQYRQSSPASTVTVIGAHGGTYTYSNRPTTTCKTSSVVTFNSRW